VSVRSWKGKVYVDMREFYVKDGKTLPTRKGTASAFFPLIAILPFLSTGLFPSSASHVRVERSKAMRLARFVVLDGFALGLDKGRWWVYCRNQ